ncbi:MAG: hypothetical protein F6J98_24585 [Moorea sp. SIO4G2]|nr:hypothetical protein [Moorena sp. SIO4G2]
MLETVGVTSNSLLFCRHPTPPHRTPHTPHPTPHTPHPTPYSLLPTPYSQMVNVPNHGGH